MAGLWPFAKHASFCLLSLVMYPALAGLLLCQGTGLWSSVKTKKCWPVITFTLCVNLVCMSLWLKGHESQTVIENLVYWCYLLSSLNFIVIIIFNIKQDNSTFNDFSCRYVSFTPQNWPHYQTCGSCTDWPNHHLWKPNDWSYLHCCLEYDQYVLGIWASSKGLWILPCSCLERFQLMWVELWIYG